MVQDLCEANNTHKEMENPFLVLLFRKPDESIQTKCISTFTDAAFNISGHSKYVQTEVLCEIEFKPSVQIQI